MIMESPRRACVATCVTWNLRTVNSHIVSVVVAWQYAIAIAIAPISAKISLLFIIMFVFNNFPLYSYISTRSRSLSLYLSAVLLTTK